MGEVYYIKRTTIGRSLPSREILFLNGLRSIIVHCISCTQKTLELDPRCTVHFRIPANSYNQHLELNEKLNYTFIFLVKNYLIYMK